jgi:hypothetical protein
VVVHVDAPACDYAREILDVEERTAQAMAQLSRGLRSRPLLRAAVRSGEVTVRSALAVRGLTPDQLVWEVGGRIWKDGDFGMSAAEAEPEA